MRETSSQRWHPRRYAADASFVPRLGLSLVEALEPAPGERILDLGCGDGSLTAELVAAGARVVGIDSSPEMVAAATERGIDARVMDAASLPFDEEFDAVLSNAVLHWIGAQDAALDGVWRALRPGGRFVAEMGGRGNVAQIVAALSAARARRGLDVPEPWYFPSAEDYARLLRAHGFEIAAIHLLPRPTPLPGQLSAWVEIFGQAFLAGLAGADRTSFLAEIADALRPTLCDANGNWTADYVRLRFSAAKIAT